MRVTQSMLANNMLRNLSSSYERQSILQDQLTTQKKITRPSQDPVVATMGIRYRADLDRIQQYQRNLGEVYNWLDSTDSALDQTTQVLQRIRELTVEASNLGVNTSDELTNIKAEVEQLKEQLVDIGNSQVGGKYIFNGLSTTTPPLDNTDSATLATSITNLATNDGSVNIEVFSGVTLQVNTSGKEIFGDNSGTGGTNLFSDIQALINDLDSGNPASLDQHITTIQNNIDNVIAVRADVGARQNRAETMESRLSAQEISVTKMLSNNEDVDIEKVITQLTIEDSVLRASLSVGSNIIQPTLVDFLR